MTLHPFVPACVVVAVVVATSGCARQEIMARPGVSKLTAAPVPAPPPALVIAPEIRSQCDVHERDGALYMKIVFDAALLTRTDVGALEQLATCFTTGPMKGRTLTLSGRADGERRTDAAQGVLVSFGMPLANVTSTLRGGTNAAGKDEAARQTDRDIDIDVEAIR